jgi:hypothetical protein
MARRIALHGFALLVVFGCVAKAYAQEDDLQSAADEAGVSVVDLAGALSTTGLDARSYLIAVGELAAPRPVCGWPICGPLGQRIYCVEAIESHHGAEMYNPTPWHGEHAQGFLGWLPSTARRWGVVIGNRASEWDAAARMVAAGAGRQFYGIAAGLC